MFLKLCLAAAILSASFSAHSQVLLKVVHGRNNETKVYNSRNLELSKPEIKLKHGETITIEVVNPNPVFYNYKLKYENIQMETEDKVITDLLSTFNTVMSARMTAMVGKVNPVVEYRKAINILVDDINKAKNYITLSDWPELSEDALNLRRSGGLRKALDDISKLESTKFHFNSSNLLIDLNAMADAAAGGDLEEQAFLRLLNAALVEKVAELKSKMNPQTTQSIWRQEFRATDTAAKIMLAINPIDKANKTLVRDGNSEKEFILELGSVIPYYKRSVLELVPVANFIFAGEVREFYLDNKIVQNRLRTKTTLMPGTVLNVNLVRFGETKEISLGVGPGYQFNGKGDGFENFYFSTMLSYKNFLRIGFGAGFTQFPSLSLKEGGKIGQPLPDNVSNLNDLINYEEKPSVFLTVAFTGLNLSKKK